MKRETLKTLAGLIVIVGIVVATFMYGNSQRQAQLKHDQDVKKQQQAKVATVSPSATATPAATATATVTPKATNTATPTPTPKPTATPTPQVASNTAPVKSPTSSTLQGSGGSGTTLGTSTTASPVATPAAVGDSNLPQTGPEMVGLLGLSSIGAMAVAVRRSRRAMLNAARSRR